MEEIDYDSDSKFSSDSSWSVIDQKTNNCGDIVDFTFEEKNIESDNTDSDIVVIEKEKVVKPKKKKKAKNKSKNESLSENDLGQEKTKENEDNNSTKKKDKESADRFKKPEAEDLIPFMTGVSLGTLLTVCGLSIVFLNTNTLTKYRNQKMSNCSLTAPTCYCTNGTWFKSLCKLMQEEELMKDYCSNKFRQNDFKRRFKTLNKKNTNRYIKQTTRDFNYIKPLKTKLSYNKKKPELYYSGPLRPNETDLYEEIYLDQADTFIENLNKSQTDLETYKSKDSIQEDYNRKFTENLINLELKQNNETVLHKPLSNNSCNILLNSNDPVQEKLVSENVHPINLSGQQLKQSGMKTNYLDNLFKEFIDGEETFKKLQSDVLDKKDTCQNAEMFLFNTDYSIVILQDRINAMEKENKTIEEVIAKQKQIAHELYLKIKCKKSFMENRNALVDILRSRLNSLEKMKENDELTSTKTDVSSNDNVINYFDESKRKSMGSKMLDDIINKNISKMAAMNTCLYEEKECDGLENNTQDQHVSAESEKHNITRYKTINKNQPIKFNSTLPKTNIRVAQWDQQTLWLSRKLNDKEHAKLTAKFPKCNPKRTWVRSMKKIHYNN